jgi:hypothetical protein
MANMETVSVPYSKIDARFQFTADNETAERLSEKFHGQFHLFEHVYSDEVHFWYGVAHIECTYKQFREPMRVAGGPLSICVRVELSDGRTGVARVQYCKDDVDGTIFLSLVGITSLRVA